MTPATWSRRWACIANCWRSRECCNAPSSLRQRIAAGGYGQPPAGGETGGPRHAFAADSGSGLGRCRPESTAARLVPSATARVNAGAGICCRRSRSTTWPRSCWPTAICWRRWRALDHPDGGSRGRRAAGAADRRRTDPGAGQPGEECSRSHARGGANPDDPARAGARTRRRANACA